MSEEATLSSLGKLEDDKMPSIPPTVSEENQEDQLQEVEELEEEYDPNSFLELGDHILINSAKYGKVIGRVYYRDGELLRLMPDGVSDRLYDFPRIYNDEEDRFDDDLGVTEIYMIEKRVKPTFVEQQDFQVGQTLETISEGERGEEKYIITAINPELDNITVFDESENEKTIEFNFTGIPLDESYDVLRILEQPPEKEEKKRPIETLSEEELKALQSANEVAERENEEAGEKDDAFELGDDEGFIKVIGKVVIPKMAIYREAKQAEKTYSDSLQKADALNDFLNMLDPIAQKDQKALRALRVLVETIFNMKQETVAYNDDGTVKGEREVSVNYLSDLLTKANAPLSRPVLDIVLRIYTDVEDLEYNDQQFYNVDFIQEFTAIVSGASAIASGSGDEKVFRATQKEFFEKYGKVWRANSTNKPLFTSFVDSEFFRYEIPDARKIDEDEEEEKEDEDEDEEEEEELEDEVERDEQLEGLHYTKPEKKVGSYPVIKPIGFSIRRGLATTYYKDPKKRKEILVNPDQATIKSYLLFPFSTAPYIGAKRSSFLAIDSARSQMRLKLLRDILIKLGGPKEVTTANNILALKATGTSFGNIPISDYIDGVNMPGTGLGDVHQYLVELGLASFELTPEILASIESKLVKYQDEIRANLAELREILAINQKPAEPNPLLQDPDILTTSIRTEPILVESIELFNRLNNIGESELAIPNDIALVAYLLAKHNDYFQAAIGQQPLFVAQERLRTVRDRYITRLFIERLLAKKKLERGEPPKPNRCEHVAKLDTIRKISDDTERFQLLTKFFAKFQGDRDGDFINCIICKQHLLCTHERMQIQGFLNPKENPNLQKEIILNFSGGLFAGSYICKNCGQPIKDLPYDTNLEYDDEGRPLVGRAVLVDYEQLYKQELDIAIYEPPVKKAKYVEFKSKMEEQFRDIVHELAIRIGVGLPEQAYRRIVERMVVYQSKLPSKEEFNKRQKEKQKDASKKMKDYEQEYARLIISSGAVYLLVEIQTRIPDYVVQYNLMNCEASFEGYPLGSEADKRALTYLACAVSSVRKNEYPWNKTGFRFGKKSIDVILAYMDSVFQTTKKYNQTVSQDLALKRAYLESKAAKLEQTFAERIPEGFLPEMKKPEDVVVPEVVARMANSGMADAWIRQANELARKTAIIIRGTPYTTTTCCVSNIQTPSSFWQSASDLIKLGIRTMNPNYRVPNLWVHFKPRPVSEIAVEADDDLNYRLFLKVCHTGPNKGNMHEVGLTFKCRQCGFQFPCNPTVIDADNDSSDGKLAVSSQGIDTSREAFEDLLDTVHLNNQIESYRVKHVETTDELLTRLAEIEPQPFDGWENLINTTFAELQRLGNGANNADIINALADLSNKASEAEEKLKAKLPTYAPTIDLLNSLSWDNLMQVIYTYFIVPYTRLLTAYKSDAYKFVLYKASFKDINEDKSIELERIWSEYSELADDNKVAIETIMDIDNNLFNIFDGPVKKSVNVQNKLSQCVERFSALYKFKDDLHSGILYGRERTLKYIKDALFNGILAELIDPSYTSGGTVIDIGKSIDGIVRILSGTLKKFNQERLAFSDEELKDLLMDTVEKEKAQIISDFDKMDDDEKVVELIKKNLRIGRWAVGGTKAIWAYDADQYERERIEREKAGIIDFPGSNIVFDAEETHFGDGYDFTQTNEDNA
jgi:hypothetical protein